MAFFLFGQQHIIEKRTGKKAQLLTISNSLRAQHEQ